MIMAQLMCNSSVTNEAKQSKSVYLRNTSTSQPFVFFKQLWYRLLNTNRSGTKYVFKKNLPVPLFSRSALTQISTTNYELPYNCRTLKQSYKQAKNETWQLNTSHTGQVPVYKALTTVPSFTNLNTLGGKVLYNKLRGHIHYCTQSKTSKDAFIHVPQF